MSRGRSLKLVLLLLVALTFALVAASCGGDDDEAGAGGTLVFAGASDPVVIDGALVSDGESIRVITQIFETLVGLKPGTTEVEPVLAESYEVNEDATVFTFNIRDGVTFHDGTDLDAAAVCFNFNRWYNFSGPLQSASASYYWQAFFGGYKNNESEDLSPSLFKSCTTPDPMTAVITLTKPSASMLAALTQQAFSIASPDALRQYNADQGTLDEETGFRPTGTFGTEHPIGTGPFKFESWTREDRLVLSRYDDYWGEKAKLEELIIRPIADNAARLQALQSDDILKILERPAFNVAYVTINHRMKPMDNPLVRQAVAHGLDRESVVNNFYGGRAVVAKEFMPPEVVGYADDVKEYPYDPERSKQLLRQAGLTLPVRIDFWYPSDVSRPYMPDPKRNFEGFRASLEKSGFEVTPHTAPWDPEYLGRLDEGNAGHLNLIGWTGDFADADNFIGVFFQSFSPQWGFRNQEIFDILDRAEAEPDEAERERLYQEANRMIMEFLPGVPYAHSEPALGFRADVQGYVPSPTTNEEFASVSFGEEGGE